MNTYRIKKSLAVASLFVVFAFTAGIGCPKDPYRASLSGSAEVADAVHEAVTAEIQYYGLGKVSDQEKQITAGYLNTVTDANMKFRHGVEDLHQRGVVDKAAYLATAQTFVDSVPTDPLAFGYKNPDAQKKFSTVLGAVKTAINLISVTVQSAKGAK